MVTSIKPTATANTIWHRLLTKPMPLPLKRLIMCPMPKVTLEIIIADFTLSFAIEANRSP